MTAPPHRMRRGRIVAVVVVLAAIAAGIAGLVVMRQGTASPERFCSELGDLAGLPETVSTGDPEGLRQAARQLGSLQSVSPATISDAVGVLASTVETMATAAATASEAFGGPPSPQLDQVALQAALGAIAPSIADVEEASANVEAYAAETCGVTLRLGP